MWQYAGDELEPFPSAACASSEAPRTRGASSGSKVRSARHQRRFSVAPTAQLEGPDAMSMHTMPSLPACFASPNPLSHAFLRPLGCAVGSSDPKSNSAFDQPKMAENMPMVAGIDVYAKETVIGGAGDEDSASLHRRLHSRRCRSCNGRNRRLSGR